MHKRNLTIGIIAILGFSLGLFLNQLQSEPTPDPVINDKPAVKDTPKDPPVGRPLTVDEKIATFDTDVRSITRDQKIALKKEFYQDKIAQILPVTWVDSQSRTIEVSEFGLVENGVYVYVRAWEAGGAQIGFGKDGTVEYERLIFNNPPVLVEDENGSIERTFSELGQDDVERPYTKNFALDPLRALQESIEHTVTIVAKDGSNIIPGLRGNTVSTFYPDADTETNTVDGYAESINASWETARDTASGPSASDSATSADTRAGRTGANDYNIFRTFFLFDTSSIPDTDAVDSATFSLYVTQTFDEDNDSQAYIAVTKTDPSSDTAIATGDYTRVEGTDNTIPLTADQPIKKLSSTELNITDVTTSAYSDFTLNADGISNISLTGISKFGAAEGHDIEDVPIAGSGLTRSVLRHSMADVSGTSQDPKLVVTHSAAAAAAVQYQDVVWFE